MKITTELMKIWELKVVTLSITKEEQFRPKMTEILAWDQAKTKAEIYWRKSSTGQRLIKVQNRLSTVTMAFHIAKLHI